MSKDTDALYKATKEFIENRGGKVVVIGGVQVFQWPGLDGKYKFFLAIGITGRMPERPPSEDLADVLETEDATPSP